MSKERAETFSEDARNQTAVARQYRNYFITPPFLSSSTVAVFDQITIPGLTPSDAEKLKEFIEKKSHPQG